MIGMNDFGIERRRRIINTFVTCVIVFDHETIVCIDTDNYPDRFDKKEWYDDIDWDEALKQEIYDKNGILILNAPAHHISRALIKTIRLF